MKVKQQALEKKIAFIQQLLTSAKENQAAFSENLQLLNRKIHYRQELLNNLDIYLSQLDREIAHLRVDIGNKRTKIEQHKDHYRQMMRRAYKMRNDRASLAFILSSTSFNQANKRMTYLKQFKEYRQEQIKKIERRLSELENSLIVLEQKRAEKKAVINSKINEQRNYVNDREKQRQKMGELKQKEKQLLRELNDKKKRAREVQRAINAAINREISAAKKREKKTTAKARKEVALSNKGFEANKGKLPWPVKKGTITKKFGKQPHPVHANVSTYNNGIDITTVKQSTVRAVYSGEVTSVIIIPGAGKAVIVKHGNYRTIYSNLRETYVVTGNKVNAKQEIGALLVNASNHSEVHFEIRKVADDGQISNINPSYWLYQ